MHQTPPAPVLKPLPSPTDVDEFTLNEYEVDSQNEIKKFRRPILVIDYLEQKLNW